jgi:hypothetical protein
MKLNGVVSFKIILFTGIYTIIGFLIPLQQGSPSFTYLIGTALTGLLYSILLRYLLQSMTIKAKGRFITVWLAIWVIQLSNPLLEGIFFTDQFTDLTIILGALVFGIILSTIYAASAVILFKPECVDTSLGQRFRDYFSRRNASDWVWRLIAVALSWIIIYYVFGRMVAPWVMPYYNDPTSGFSLVYPSLIELLSLQSVRGFIYVGSLMPLMVAVKVDFHRAFLVIASLMFIGGGLAIFLIVETFPLVLRMFHSIDLAADSIVFGYVFSFLLIRD